jgi:transcriptional regulator with XRE-family HTH domain
MDTIAPMEALRRRAFDARVTLQELCIRAGVAQAAFTRSAQGKQVYVTTLRKIEDAMAQIEAEKSNPSTQEKEPANG